jgi:hypothetical protein
LKTKFSKPLIKKCQKLIFKKSGKRITSAQADLYLEKLSRLMITSVKIYDQEKNNKIKR